MSSTPVLVIDPGHGGDAAAGGSSPNNATGPNGLLEKDLTLDIARRVAALLRGRAEVILTRDGDRNLSLTERAGIARGRDADLFLSIHLNGFRDPAVDGTETWIARSANEASRRFARAVQEHVITVTGAGDRGLRERDLGVLLPSRHAARTGACLLEIAFLSNPDTARKLEDAAYRDRLARAVADAVEDRLAQGTATAQGAALGAPEAAIIASHSDWGGLNLKERELAADLLGRLPADAPLVGRVFDELGWSDRDDVAFHLLDQASDAQVSAVAGAPDGRALLMRLVRELQEGDTDDADLRQIERAIRLASPTHARLRAEPWKADPAITAALAAAGATLQSIDDGTGEPVYDEYSVTMSAMPPGVTPEAYLAEMLADLTAAVANPAFDRVNTFARRSSGPPAVGEVIDIDIVGPDNGSVILVAIAPDHFVYQTITSPSSGVHPENGSRQFGFERTNGDVVFYTRGASRPSSFAHGVGGMVPQNLGWTALAEGIAAELTRRGGSQRAGSFTYWTSRPHGPTTSLGVPTRALGPAEAQSAVAAFRARTGAGAFTPRRDDVADRLAQLIADPTLVDQASLNLCGPAAFARLWLKRDPDAFAAYVISLFETGRASIGSYAVAPGEDLRENDYYNHAVPAMRALARTGEDPAMYVCQSAEWIGLGALRDVSNLFLDFEGMPDETVAAGTSSAEVAEWLRVTGVYRDVRDEGNWFFTKDLSHALGLMPGDARDVALLINAHIMTGAARAGGRKSDEFILSAFPNHFVVLESPVTQPAPDTVEMDVWSWGHVHRLRLRTDVFLANYYGAVIADR